MIKIYSDENTDKYCQLAAAAYRLLSLEGSAAIELDFVTRQKIREINKEFRGIDSPTDVLSFPMLESIKPFNKQNYPFDTDENGDISLGSIIICTQVALENAAEYGHSAQRELCYLFVHGLLHLFGFDHAEEAERMEMRMAEEEILSAVGESRKDI